MRKVKLYDALFRCKYALYVGDFDEFIDEVRKDKAYPGDPRSHVDAVCMELSFLYLYGGASGMLHGGSSLLRSPCVDP